MYIYKCIYKNKNTHIYVCIYIYIYILTHTYAPNTKTRNLLSRS